MLLGSHNRGAFAPRRAGHPLTMTERPAQSQPYPGRTGDMAPEPRDEMRDYTGSGLLDGRRALITGGDSGIGRATAVAFAKEGADVAITYLEEDDDARHTASLVKSAGRRCFTFGGDLAEGRHCREVVEHTVRDLGGLDLLVLHHGTQTPVKDVRDIDDAQLRGRRRHHAETCSRTRRRSAVSGTSR